jgi:hypothetical protein
VFFAKCSLAVYILCLGCAEVKDFQTRHRDGFAVKAKRTSHRVFPFSLPLPNLGCRKLSKFIPLRDFDLYTLLTNSVWICGAKFGFDNRVLISREPRLAHWVIWFNHNYCTICQLVNTIMDKDHLLVCPKLDYTTNELPKLYWDARRLME